MADSRMIGKTPGKGTSLVMKPGPRVGVRIGGAAMVRLARSRASSFASTIGTSPTEVGAGGAVGDEP